MSSSSVSIARFAWKRSGGIWYIVPINWNDSSRGRSHQSWLRCPKTTPILRAFRSRLSHGTRPATVALPLVGTRMPVSILIVVDFPAPFGPR